jgi:hypothetical protein
VLAAPTSGTVPQPRSWLRPRHRGLSAASPDLRCRRRGSSSPTHATVTARTASPRHVPEAARRLFEVCADQEQEYEEGRRPAWRTSGCAMVAATTRSTSGLKTSYAICPRRRDAHPPRSGDVHKPASIRSSANRPKLPCRRRSALIAETLTLRHELTVIDRPRGRRAHMLAIAELSVPVDT